jgi:hypothetical protein
MTGDLVKDDAWNTVQAGLLTLAAFVVGLCFAQASARFDARRELVVKEGNAIGTTWLRADQLAPAQAQQLLTDFDRLHGRPAEGLQRTASVPANDRSKRSGSGNNVVDGVARAARTSDESRALALDANAQRHDRRLRRATPGALRTRTDRDRRSGTRAADARHIFDRKPFRARRIAAADLKPRLRHRMHGRDQPWPRGTTGPRAASWVRTTRTCCTATGTMD